MSTIRLEEAEAPPTPITGKGIIYIKTDGVVYFKNDEGTESDLTQSGGGNSFGIVTGDSGTATSNSGNDTLTITGGEGIITTASDAPEDVNIVIDLSEFVTDTSIASGDLIAFRDISPAANNLITFANFEAALSITQGKFTKWISVSEMSPPTTAGAGSLSQVEVTAGNPNIIDALLFSPDDDEAAQFDIAWPKRWNEGTLTYQVFWLVRSTASGDVAWALQAVAISHSQDFDTAYGTAVVRIASSESTVDDVLVSAESTAVTVGGTPAEDDLVYFRFFRDTSDGGDNLNTFPVLLGIKLFWTTNAENDD